ncbi:hypothetical protein NDU88_002901 [Pleurodeles waltl]|uniref:Uncharacterized protein n=1 Tax=Pleurodeles waltl TaxID=8319 RepID=A0AAV7RGP4_PLEWA|nr:hypothetical protein NDU88_002901 [Pleurodeles waltl]
MPLSTPGGTRRSSIQHYVPVRDDVRMESAGIRGNKEEAGRTEGEERELDKNIEDKDEERGIKRNALLKSDDLKGNRGGPS